MDAVDVKMDFRNRDIAGLWIAQVDQIATGGVLPNNLKAVARVMLEIADRAGTSWPSHETISDRADVSVSVVKRALRALREAGMIEWSRRWARNGWEVTQSSNLYRLIIEKSLLGQLGRRVRKTLFNKDRRANRKAMAEANKAKKALYRVVGAPWWAGKSKEATPDRAIGCLERTIQAMRDRGTVTC